MRADNTVSITLPANLLVKAQALAEQEHRTMSEIFSEARTVTCGKTPLGMRCSNGPGM